MYETDEFSNIENHFPTLILTNLEFFDISWSLFSQSQNGARTNWTHYSVLKVFWNPNLRKSPLIHWKSQFCAFLKAFGASGNARAENWEFLCFDFSVTQLTKLILETRVPTNSTHENCKENSKKVVRESVRILICDFYYRCSKG